MFRRTTPIPTSILESELGRAAPRRELDAIERVGTEVRLPVGRQIITEDSPGRECMLVIEGSLDVERAGSALGRIGPGEFVGEMALLNRRLRSATVTVAEPTLAYAFSRRDFASLLAECPALASHVRGLAADREVLSAAA